MSTTADKIRQLRDMFREGSGPWGLAQSIIDDMSKPAHDPERDVWREPAAAPQADGFDPAYRKRQERNERDRARRAAARK